MQNLGHRSMEIHCNCFFLFENSHENAGKKKDWRGIQGADHIEPCCPKEFGAYPKTDRKP